MFSDPGLHPHLGFSLLSARQVNKYSHAGRLEIKAQRRPDVEWQVGARQQQLCYCVNYINIYFIWKYLDMTFGPYRPALHQASDSCLEKYSNMYFNTFFLGHADKPALVLQDSSFRATSREGSTSFTPWALRFLITALAQSSAAWRWRG